MKNNAGKDLLMLLLGIGMFGSGLVIFFLNVKVTSGYGHNFWGLTGGFDVTGVLFIPIILGIILWIMFSKSIWPKILTWVGVISMVLAIISDLRITFPLDSVFSVFMYIILIFGGGALALKKLYIDGPKKNNDSNNN